VMMARIDTMVRGDTPARPAVASEVAPSPAGSP